MLPEEALVLGMKALGGRGIIETHLGGDGGGWRGAGG
jgi:hypothetical protein